MVFDSETYVLQEKTDDLHVDDDVEASAELYVRMRHSITNEEFYGDQFIKLDNSNSQFMLITIKKYSNKEQPFWWSLIFPNCEKN